MIGEEVGDCKISEKSSGYENLVSLKRTSLRYVYYNLLEGDKHL